MPQPGEPGSETWKGTGIEHGGAPTWFTGTYDAASSTPSTGRPAIPPPSTTATIATATTCTPTSILALDAKTGKLKWYYQFTPHDLWDWDATETPVLVDANWEGRPRKLLLHANRNGFFYVLDRTDGKLLLAKPFVQNLTWAKGIGADGRPIKNPNQEPTAGRHARLPVAGRRDQLVLALVQSRDRACTTCRRSRSAASTRRPSRANGRPARPISADRRRRAPDEKPERILKAIDIRTGQDRVGAAAARPRRVVGRNAVDGDRPRVLRRGRRRVHGRRRCHRQAALEFPDESDLEGVADDV